MKTYHLNEKLNLHLCVESRQKGRLLLDPAQAEEVKQDFEFLSFEVNVFDFTVAEVEGIQETYCLKGEVALSFSQASIVSLEPVITQVNDVFERYFTTESSSVEQAVDKSLEQAELVINPFEENLPEFLSESQLEVYDLFYDVLGDFVPLYPKNEGEQFSFVDEDDQQNPFAVLKKLSGMKS